MGGYLIWWLPYIRTAHIIFFVEITRWFFSFVILLNMKAVDQIAKLLLIVVTASCLKWNKDSGIYITYFSNWLTYKRRYILCTNKAGNVFEILLGGKRDSKMTFRFNVQVGVTELMKMSLQTAQDLDLTEVCLVILQVVGFFFFFYKKHLLQDISVKMEKQVTSSWTKAWIQVTFIFHHF